MPIPRGAHYVPGQPNRVRLPNGDIVTRATARTQGAREYGYKNEHAMRGHAAGDQKYFQAFMRTEAGQHAMQTALAKSQATGQAMSEKQIQEQIKRDLIAARNQKPSGRRSGGASYTHFMAEYDLVDYEDWVDY